MSSIESLLTLTRQFGSGVLYNGQVNPAVTKTKLTVMGNKKREGIAENARELRLVYGWIEFPTWAAQLSQTKSSIDNACRLAKECERYSNTIRIRNKCPNGRYSSLESMFRTHLVPFDCGGEDAIDNMPWEGWWRPGYRRLVISEITSIGEKFVTLGDLQSVINKNHGDALRDALRVLITSHESLPPTTLQESKAPARL